jgi:hypothetical protein
VAVHLRFSANGCACPTCIWFVRVGWGEEAGPRACVWSGIPGCGGVTETVDFSLGTPDEPGDYGLRVDRTLDFSCSLGAWDAVGTYRPNELARLCTE